MEMNSKQLAKSQRIIKNKEIRKHNNNLPLFSMYFITHLIFAEKKAIIEHLNGIVLLYKNELD